MRGGNRKGVAMLAALGVLVILGLLSSAFTAHMRLASAYTSRAAQQLQAHYLAVAGVQDAIGRLRIDSPMVDAYGDVWWLSESPGMVPMGEGGYTLRVSDESARINILKATPQTLNALLGGDQEKAAAIVKYRTSSDLATIEDLRRAELPADTLTRVTALGTSLGDGRVNVNTANADALGSLPGMDPEAAQLVVEFRRGADGIDGTPDDFIFDAPEDLAKVPKLTGVRIAPAIPLVKTNTNIFRVESVGTVYRGPRIVSNEKITAVLQRDEDRKVKVLSWESS